MLKNHIAKHLYVYTDLLRAIREGTYTPGAKLPTEEALVSHYGISRNTARQAVNNLVNEGWAKKIQGNGTFATLPKATKPTVVFAFRNMADHFYSNILKAMMERLAKRNIFPHLLHYREQDLEQFVASSKEIVLVADNPYNFLFNLVMKYREKIKAFLTLGKNVTDSPFAVNQYILDYDQGGELQARYLAGKGCGRFFYVCQSIGLNEPEYGHLKVMNPYDDFERVLKNDYAGATVQLIRLDKNLDPPPEFIDKIKNGPGKAGIALSYDFLITRVWPLLDRTGLKPQADVEIVGFFNTPWSENWYPSFASITYDTEIIATQTVDGILAASAGKSAPKRVRFAPTIVERYAKRDIIKRLSYCKDGAREQNQGTRCC